MLNGWRRKRMRASSSRPPLFLCAFFHCYLSMRRKARTFSSDFSKRERSLQVTFRVYTFLGFQTFRFVSELSFPDFFTQKILLLL